MNTIGTRPNSISRVYYIEKINREVNKIYFYNDNGIIASTRSGWLSCNPKFIDTSISDIDYLNITKELKTFKANYNIEKATGSAKIKSDTKIKMAQIYGKIEMTRGTASLQPLTKKSYAGTFLIKQYKNIMIN